MYPPGRRLRVGVIGGLAFRLHLDLLVQPLQLHLGNAWMQNPGVLEITNGVVQTTDPLAHLLSKTAFFMIAHSVSGYYLATLLCVLGVYTLLFEI